MKPAINLDSHTRQKAAKAALISLRYILLTEMKLADMSGKTAKELGIESFIQKLKTYCDTDKTLNPSKTKTANNFTATRFTCSIGAFVLFVVRAILHWVRLERAVLLLICSPLSL